MGLGLSFGSCGCRGGGGGIPPWPPPWIIPPTPIIVGGGAYFESMEIIFQWKAADATLGVGNHIEVIEFNGAAQPTTGGLNKFKLATNWGGTITTNTGKQKIVARMRSEYRNARVAVDQTVIFPFSIALTGGGIPFPDGSNESSHEYDFGPGASFRQVNFSIATNLFSTSGLDIGMTWGIHIGWE